MAESGDETGQKILNALFKEVTSLGYIGLFLFLATRSGLADQLVDVLHLGHHHGAEGSAAGGPNPLAETFETVHIMIFMLLTVLLFQAAAVLTASRQTLSTWDEYERSRAFGAAHDSLESKFIKEGYIERRDKPDQKRGVELSYGKEFGWGNTLFERIKMRENPLTKLVMWRVIRHEFLFPSASSEKSHKRSADNSEMPKPRFFSFQEYLGEKLGRTVLGLVEVDQQVWLLTLMVLIPLVFYVITLDLDSAQILQCSCAWSLLVGAWFLVNALEEETYRLTPKVPSDARQILRLLEGTNAAFAADEVVLSKNVESPTPGLHGGSSLPPPKLDRPVAFTDAEKGGTERPNGDFLPTKLYERAFQVIAFWQAVIVTSLIVTYLSEPIETPLEQLLYALAWAEWPIMLFWLVPIYLRRFTMRNSIEGKKDVKLIRRVSLKTKEGLLKDYLRLVQIFKMVERARASGESWATPGHDGWTTKHAEERFETGLVPFRSLPQADKLDIWKIFAAWDVNNDESVSVNEISETLVSMKPPSDPKVAMETASALIRLVDHDGAGTLTWRKFKALVMLATVDKPREEVLDDLNDFFDILDTDKDGEITIFELAEWSKRGPIGMERDEFATLLYKHFDKAKPSVTRSEFVDWIEAF
jgi:Ca2+-binding EF-hand superfamily protein